MPTKRFLSSLANLVAVEVPHGTKSFSGTLSMSTFSSLTELVIPSTVTSLPDKFVRDNTVIKKMYVKQVRNDDGTVSGLTVIPNYFADIATSGYVSSFEFFGAELDYITQIKANGFLKSAIKSIRIEAPMTGISGSSFNSCKSLTTVYINNTSQTVISCGKQSFVGCDALTSVVFNGLSIGEYAFEKTYNNAGSLTIVATNVTSVGTGAFSANENLASVDISGPIASIGDNVFGNCKNITSARVYNTNEKVATCGSAVFSERTSLTSIEFHNIEIPWRGFYKLKLTPDNMKITGNFTKIGEEAFYECSNLTSFTIPESVTTIGAKAFYKTGISTVTFPGNVTSIGQRAYQFCPNLETVYFKASNAGVVLSSVGDNLFGNDNMNTSANTALKKVIFDKDCNITTIGTYMFYNCDSLEYVSMPDSVTTIKAQPFYSCDNIKAIRLSTGLVDANISWTNLFVGCQKMYFVNEFITEENDDNIAKPSVYYFPNVVSSISSEVFKNCFNLNDVIVFGDKLTSVTNSYTFGRKNASADLGVKSIVFLGDVTALSYGGEGAHTNFYVAGENATVASSKSGTCNVYVCKEEGTPHLVEVYNLSQDATCTENQMTFDRCFCGAKINKAEVENSALGHNHDLANAISIVYADYTKNGMFTAACLRCEAEISEEIAGSHLFTYNGISTSSDGTGLCAGYILNYEYIEIYENLKGVSFEFGGLATIITGDNKSPLSSDYAGVVIHVGLNEVEKLSAIDILVRGDYTDETPDDVSLYDMHNLAMTLYVIDADNVFYIWDSTETELGTNTFVAVTPIYVPKKKA